MVHNRINIQEILHFLGNKIIRIDGSVQNVYIDNLAETDRVSDSTLDWINPSIQNKQQVGENSKARVLLVDSSVQSIEGKTLIIVNNPKVAIAEIGNHFFVKKIDFGIHPSAIIHPEAKIGRGCNIGPYTFIGKAEIGDKCNIDSHVCIYDDVVMGHDCVIKAGAVLGGTGFGYERDENGNLFRFPQIGQLIIGNHVEVGSNTCIDRGALADTVIGDYTKINNLCHIAHNNKIGKNVTITGCVNISGSNVINDNVWIAPNASVRGWINIGESATIGMAAVVVKDVPAHETWVGHPAHKISEK